jgi:hypothetical protein
LFVLGIDPGKKGAFAIYDVGKQELLDCIDIPTNGKTGAACQYDRSAMESYFERGLPVWPDFAVLEQLEERPVFVKGKMQPRTGMLTLGIGWGYVDLLLHIKRIRTHYVRPNQWKPKLKCGPDSVFRAEQLFPTQRELFRGPRGGLMDGRADAAMIAMYGANFIEVH